MVPIISILMFRFQLMAWAQSHDLQSQLSQVGQEELELLYSLKTFIQCL